MLAGKGEFVAKYAAYIILTAICGAGIVTVETPANLLLFTIWATVVFIAGRRLCARSGTRKALVATATHATLFAAIYFAALLAPGKRMDTMLKKTIALPEKNTTIGQLADFCSTNRSKLPIRISLPAGGTFADSSVQFGQTSVTVLEFIATIEQQTGCKHYISGCGNAYTVLRGPAYNFGLSFQAPAGSDASW